MSRHTPHHQPSSSSGYESDRSSVNGSAALDGDTMDEDEAASLTRQLAETAQGVREMSKELGQSSSFESPPH
jgi:NAD+ kinase